MRVRTFSENIQARCQEDRYPLLRSSFYALNKFYPQPFQWTTLPKQSTCPSTITTQNCTLHKSNESIPPFSTRIFPLYPLSYCIPEFHSTQISKRFSRAKIEYHWNRFLQLYLSIPLPTILNTKSLLQNCKKRKNYTFKNPLKNNYFSRARPDKIL